MPQRIIFGVLALGVLFAGLLLGVAADGEKKAAPAAEKPYGLDKRVPWLTSKVRGSPEPPSPFKTEIAFPKLKFDEPLELASAQGSPRIFVVERYGRVFSFPNEPQTDKADLLLDLNQLLGRTTPKTLAAYGFAPHPQFARNGFVYITYVIDADKELANGTRVSRFHVPSGDPLRCDPKSEQILIEWPSGGHNGGCLKFGPDGFLYIATGDSSGIADQYLTGQDVGVLPGKILRIDVDHSDPGKHYGIPKDNPFVGKQGARAEIWSYGLRQPWKMSFDSATGDLWTGNVGQDLWEQIYRIEPGGNYGWSILEGSHPFRAERPRGPSPILMPVVEHDHANFRSITGGFVYHGKRLKDLIGAYIYGDYDTGRIWTFRYDRQKKAVSGHRELFKSNLRIVGFGEDPDGELYLVDHMGGRIHRLAPNPAEDTAAQFPRRLSATGLFASTKDYRPSPGLIPYSVIAPQWCDGATKERLLGLPGKSQIEFEAIIYPQPAPGAMPGWKFPDGAVIAETIFLEMEAGNPASRRRLETRVLHNERLVGTEEVGDQYWRGYTYIWNDDQTDAALLEDPQGKDQTFTIRDAKAPDGKRQQTWHFPSRTECIACHNMAAKYVLGLQTVQANRDHDYDGVVANQLRTFDHLGLFTKPLPAPPDELPRLLDYREGTDKARSSPLNLRARSYLHANCSHCHRKWGGGNTEFQLLATLDLAETGTYGVRPAHGTFNIANARILASGDPYRSVLFYRMAALGPGRMPRIGSNMVDEAGVRLIHDWIAQLPAAGLVEDVASRASARDAAAVDRLAAAGAKAEDLNRQIDPLLASTGSALRLMQALGDEAVPQSVRAAAVARATQSDVTEVRDLFERFLPEERRIKRLGSVVRPEQILGLPGDIARGRKLFFDATGVQCRTCHRIGGKGIEIGPDLDQIGKKYDRAQILDNILFPSKQIDPKYVVYLVETKQGQAFTGLLVSKDATKVVLKDATNKRIEVAAGEVEVMAPQAKSLMPELLLRDLTAEDVADLTAFLSSLK
jgi:putative heme-binding domain-containing protein